MGYALFQPMTRQVLLLVTVAALSAPAHVALAADAPGETDTFARVVVSETDLRSGPGVSHRVVHRAERGETFLVEAREGAGYWLQVVLPDGRVAYVLGDTVERIAAGPEDAGAQKPGLFAPPALQEARAGFALAGGVFDLDGYVELKPALVLAPAIAIEPYVGLALERESRRLVYGLGGTLNLAPDWAIAPYVHLGVGGVDEEPRDEFVRKEREWFHARAGGGLLISLRFRVLIRLEATNVLLFTEDDQENVQAYIGGLGTYF